MPTEQQVPTASDQENIKNDNVPQSKASRRKTGLVIAALALIFLLVGGVWLWRQGSPGTSPQPPSTHQPQPTPRDISTPVFDTSVVLSGRPHIWDIAFLPSKEMLFTERAGTVNLFTSGEAKELARISDVQAVGEGGLLGLAVDPNFSQNRYIYTCFNSKAADMRIVRWRVASDLKSLQDRKDIVSGIPANTTTFPGRHSGCRLAFGPDGYLWVGTGDTAQGNTAIQPKGLGGKVLRVDRAGKAAPGNLGSGFDSRIYSYGHRNIQGIAFFPSDKNGTLGVSVEHGSGVDDEVNELKKGNFGWAPPAAGYDESVPMTDIARFPDAISAIWSSGAPTQAPSGAAIIHGQDWKGWDGAVAVAMLKAQHLKVLRLDTKNQVTKEEKILVGEFGRLRAVTQGPDGNLYISTDNSSDNKIIKLSPKE